MIRNDDDEGGVSLFGGFFVNQWSFPGGPQKFRLLQTSLREMKRVTRVRHILFAVSVLVIIGRAANGANPELSSDQRKKVDKTKELSPPKKTQSAAGGSGKGSGQGALTFDCIQEDTECNKDKLGYDAISNLHRLLDDDQNGNVDQSESDEFLRDELQYTDGFERHSLFHNNDKLISVDDLWKAWKFSEVYNWTVDDVIDWLQKEVDLPQYSSVFQDNHVSGPFLPRLASASVFVTSVLGIKNPVHKQKLSLKAMDTVLFGAPPKRHNYVKDLVLVASLIFAVGGCWFAYLHHRYSQEQVRKMMLDLESLQKAEEALQDVQRKLVDAENRQNSEDFTEGVIRKALGEDRLGEPSRQIKDELEATRLALQHAENQLESQWSAPGELQAWLQLTHELEQVHYNAKRQAAERQFQAAKESCDKIKRRNKAIFGSLRMAHSNSIDEIDQRILDARMALEEVKQDLQERLHRWHTIERLCGFPIISNPGLATLHQVLHGASQGANTSRLPGAVVGPVSVDEADEDMPPAAFPCTMPNGLSRPRALSTEVELAHGLPYALFPDTLHIEKEKLKNMRNNFRRQPRFSYPPLHGVPSKNTMRQRNGMGSTGSLSHLSRTGIQAHSPSYATLNSVHRGSHDDGTSPIAGNLANPVTFHLGDQHGHDSRSAVINYINQHHSHPTSTPRSGTGTPNTTGYSAASALTPGYPASISSAHSAGQSTSAVFSHSKSLNFSDSDDNLSQATMDSLPRSVSSSVVRDRLHAVNNGLDLVSHTQSVISEDAPLALGGQKKPSKKKKLLGIFRKTQKQKSV